MKLFAAFLSVLFAGSLAQASHTACHNSDLFYSYKRVDTGIPPYPGFKIGSETLVYQGKVLVNREIIAGEGGYDTGRYEFALGSSRKTLQKSGNQTAGSTIFTSPVIVYEIDQVNPGKRTEVVKTSVVCTESWAMVP